jgi:hypothetical protein
MALHLLKLTLDAKIFLEAEKTRAREQAERKGRKERKEKRSRRMPKDKGDGMKRGEGREVGRETRDGREGREGREGGGEERWEVVDEDEEQREDFKSVVMQCVLVSFHPFPSLSHPLLPPSPSPSLFPLLSSSLLIIFHS